MPRTADFRRAQRRPHHFVASFLVPEFTDRREFDILSPMKIAARPLCLLVVSLASGALSRAADLGHNDFFPFKPGRYWLYGGTVSWRREGETHDKKITGWRSEVQSVAEGNGFKAALVKGSPGDLAWYEEGKERAIVMFVLTASGEFHKIAGQDVAATFAELQKTARIPDGLLDSDTLFFATDMKEGQRFGDPEATGRGPRYCWVVERVNPHASLPGIRGLPAPGPFSAYDLAYSTNPDQTRVRFVPGIGIVSYSYEHHGTPGDCDLQLTEMGDSPAGAGGESPMSLTWQDLATREISLDELRAASLPDLRMLRNEILARHGLIFKAKDLIEHFTAQDWYRPRVHDLNDEDIPPTELANLNNIKAEEKRRN